MLGFIKTFSRFLKLKYKMKKVNTRLLSMNIENNVKIGRWCTVAKRVMLGAGTEIGDFTYLNASKYWITVESNVKIGKFCSIAPGVHIGAGNHDISTVTTHPILFDKYYLNVLGDNTVQKASGLIDKHKETVIGNDVWIGLGAIIKRGTKIGNGSVIAAGSVVVKDVPAYAVVGGNPAKVIKYRTNEENIRMFEENEEQMWWNWDDNVLSENLDNFYDFDKFAELIKGKLS